MTSKEPKPIQAADIENAKKLQIDNDINGILTIDANPDNPDNPDEGEMIGDIADTERARKDAVKAKANDRAELDMS